ncbi:hypothetical protein RvY_18913 [Ramazzottius varieornatus]|uniref:Uncharacterized protein n=1 Tax=Ramazzottius varieornatus TaxID=947166 RepID=A0A1D1W7J2_RAMVA|nr:hypothetical protein RvY_18913 [Ramazzottius varieornatus]
MDLPSGDKGGHRFRNSRDFGTVFDSSGASKDLLTIPESMQMSSDELLRFNERKSSSDAVSTVSREEVERFCEEVKKGAIGKTAKPSKPASGLPEAGSPTSAWFAYWSSMNPDMYALIKRIIVDRTLKIKDLKGQHNSTSTFNLYKGLRRANL